MRQDLEIYLTSCQAGISATSIAVGIVAEPALASIIDPMIETTLLAPFGAGTILAFLIINLLHLNHGEQIPTYLGVERTKFVARYGAPALLVCQTYLAGDRGRRQRRKMDAQTPPSRDDWGVAPNRD